MYWPSGWVGSTCDDSASSAPLPKKARCLLNLGIVFALVLTSFAPTAKASETEFNWQKLSPSSTLHWVECYTGRQCARLEVPLDYSKPTGDKAAVALLRIKANVSSDSKEYRGPMLFNPGGPGGSGVTYINEFGGPVQQAVGNSFDIIGFDPRGIGETTPAVSIFPTVVERGYWDAGAPPVLNSTVDALPRAFSRAQLFNELVDARSKRVAQHVSTAVVARDMLSITKAHGRERLQYWGISYGSILGATYAAMFPNNVERMIIDGVHAFDDYYSGSWSTNLFDTDKVLQFFYDKCASAGTACPLHANSSTLVQERVERIFTSIKTNPVPAINGSDYALIDYTILKEILFSSLYSPFSLLLPVSQILAALETGDGTPAVTLLRASLPLPKCDTPSSGVAKLEAQLAVLCGDAEGADNTLAGILQHYDKLSKISFFADVWTDESRTACAGWKVRPAERFAGPFTVNTSFPVLLIGNTADPVTPLSGAQKAANTIGGSALLTINTPGHTSFAATSLCAQKVIHNYFTKGELPKKGTVCETEDVLFGEKASWYLLRVSHKIRKFPQSDSVILL